MATCTTHPHILETRACAQCGRPFCDQCLAHLMGGAFCFDCKGLVTMGVVERRGRHPLVVIALVVPIIGYVLCAPLLPITSLIGLLLGSRVLKELRERPYYTGRSAALAALVISGGTLATWVLGVLAMLAYYMGVR